MAQTINVDTTPGLFMPTLHYSQNDVGREWVVNLSSKDGYSIPTGATVKMVATKPSGLGFTLTGSLSGNTATFTTTDTVTNEAGRFPAEIQIIKNSTVIGTANFWLEGEPNPHPEGTTDGDIDSILPQFMSVTVTTLPAGSDATYSFNAATNTATFGIPKGADGSLASGVLAPTYSSSAKYAVGDYVYYSGDLYRCITAITTAEAWTAGHWVQVAIADDVSDLRSVVNVLDGYFDECPNLFNPDDPDLVENVELKNSGNTEAKTGYFASGFIPVKAGQTVCCHYPTGTYGSASILVTYNENKERIGYTSSGVERLQDANGHNYIRYTFNANTQAKYFRVTGYIADESYYMYVYAPEMPAVYVPYTEDVTLADVVKVDYANIKNVSVTKDDTDFVKVNPKNLVDLSTMSVGIIKNSSSNGDLDSTASGWRTTDYIPVKVGETYSILSSGGVYYGNGYKGIPYYDSNKSYVGHIVPASGITTTTEWTTITIPNNCAYIRLSYPKASVENPKLWQDTSVFEGTVGTRPKAYIHYDASYRLQDAGLDSHFSSELNCLFGKTAIWNGDSICAADNDAQGGWPQRIGEANGMWAKNYAIAGGTITENVGTHHSVSATLNGMLIDFPDADYILIEGGTNDADLLGTNGIGTFDADDFTDTYINALDTDTFSGALESIFYRLVTTMKGKHIGYIIPQKMGYTEELVARRRTYFDRAIDICKKWGVPYLDLWNDYYFNWRLSAHWDPDMTSAQNESAGNLYQDGQHLTTTGYAIQAPIIAEWMKTI